MDFQSTSEVLYLAVINVVFIRDDIDFQKTNKFLLSNNHRIFESKRTDM